MRRFLLLSLLIISLLMPLSAVTTVTAVGGMSYLSDFAFGNLTSFPSGATINQKAEDLGLFKDVKSDIVMSMDFGLTGRTLVQNLTNGDYLKPNEISSGRYNYSAFYSSVTYRFDNSFIEDEYTDDYLITVSAGASVRFEQAFDSLRGLREGKDFYTIFNPEKDTQTNSYPSGYTSDGLLASVATPDINGNAYLFSNSIGVALNVNHKLVEKDNLIYREGVSGSVVLQAAPWWLLNNLPPFLGINFGGYSDFYKSTLSVSYSHVFLSKESWKRWNKLAIVLDNDTEMQILFGSAIPKYADTTHFYGIDGLNLNFIIVNQTKLYIYGPNFFTNDTIPYGYFFLDMGYAGGVPANSTGVGGKNFVYLTPGISLRLKFMGALNIFAEIGYTFSNMDTYANPLQYSLGGYFAF